MITKIKDLKFEFFKKVFLIILIFSIGFIILYYSQATSKGVIIGIKYCIEILIPSLFPIMFLSKFTSLSNILDFIKKPLDKVMKTIFYLPGSAAPVIFLSMVGGYPIGAIGVQGLFERGEINSEQLNRMMYFCMNSGPAFVISIIGGLILKNKFLGIIILIIQVSVSLIIGIISGIIARTKKVPYYAKKNINISKLNFSDIFLESASQTANSTILMCTLVIIFNVSISVVNYMGILENISYFMTKLQIKPQYVICLIISVFEITSGVFYAGNNVVSLSIISFIVTYGGICTHLQIKYILKNTSFNYKQFNVIKLLNSILVAVCVEFLLKIYELQKTVFLSTVKSVQPSVSCTKIGSMLIIILCLYFTISMHLKNNRNL